MCDWRGLLRGVELPAKHPAPPGIPPDVLSNFEKYGCLSGYSRAFSLHFVLNVIFLLWIENLGDFLGAA